MAVETLTAELVGKSSSYTAMMQGAIAQADSWGAAMQKAGLAAAAALAGGVGSSIGAFAGFDKAMVESTAIMGDMAGLTDETQKRMRDLAISLGMEGTKSAEEMARAYFYLASAGLNAEQSMAALPGMMKFAQAGAFDMALATDLATDAMSALGLTVLDDNAQLATNLQRVSDVIVRANTLANASTQQFAEALTKDAGTTMKVYNKSIEEGVAVLAAYADQGIKAALAGGMFGRMMRYMGQSAIKNAAAHEKYGVAVFDEAGNFRNLADIFADLEKAMGPVTAKKRMERLKEMGFQVLAQRAVLPLIGTSERIRGYQKALETTASGFSEKVAGRQMAAFSNQLKNLWNVVQVAAIELGQNLAPALSFVVAKAREGVLWWRALSGETKLYVGLAAGLYAAIMSVGPALAIVKFGLMALLAPAAAVLGPAGLLVTGAAAAAAALLNWSGSWEDVASSAGLTALAVGAAVVAFRVLWGVMSALKVVQIAQLGLWLSMKAAAGLYTLATAAVTAAMMGYALALASTKIFQFLTLAGTVALNFALAAAGATALATKVAFWLLNAAIMALQLGFMALTAAVAFYVGSAVVAFVMATVVAATALYDVLARMTLLDGPLAHIGDLFGEWWTILREVFALVQAGDMEKAWAVFSAGASLAVEQVKDLMAPLWSYLKEGFSAVWDYVLAVWDAEFEMRMEKAKLDVGRVAAGLSGAFKSKKEMEKVQQQWEDVAEARKRAAKGLLEARLGMSPKGTPGEGSAGAGDWGGAAIEGSEGAGDWGFGDSSWLKPVTWQAPLESAATKAAREALLDVQDPFRIKGTWADPSTWGVKEMSWLDDEHWKIVKKNATDAIVTPVEEAKRAAQGLNAVLFGGAEAQQRIEAYRAALAGTPEAGGALDDALSDLDGGTRSDDVVDTLEDIRDILKQGGTPVNVLGADLL